MFPNYKWNADLYTIFFEVCLKNFLQKEGVLSFITPRFFLFNQNCYALRKYFLENLEILNFTECNPFDAVTENEISILKKQRSSENSIKVYKHENNEIVFFNKIDKKNIKSNKYLEINPSLNNDVFKLLTKIESEKRQLSEIATSKRGAEIGKKDLKETKTGAPILLGYDVDKYYCEHTGAKIEINHKEYIRLQKYFKTHNLLLLRRVSKNLMATVSPEKTAFSKNLYGFISSELSPFYLVALLNSKVLNFYYKKKFSTKKEDVFPEIQTYLYEQLPIATPTEENAKKIIDLVIKIISSSESKINHVLEEKINNLVYKVYELDAQDIKIINEF